MRGTFRRVNTESTVARATSTAVMRRVRTASGSGRARRERAVEELQREILSPEVSRCSRARSARTCASAPARLERVQPAKEEKHLAGSSHAAAGADALRERIALATRSIVQGGTCCSRCSAEDPLHPARQSPASGHISLPASAAIAQCYCRPRGAAGCCPS